MGQLEVWVSASRELLREIRGKRSQVAFSRRLGYKSNVAADWEGGHRAPTATVLLYALERVGIDVSTGFETFHAGSAPAVEEGIDAWLRALQGSARQSEIARRFGVSRHRIRRWMSGEAEPRVPEFLGLIQALTGRAPDWVAAFVPIEEVPSLHGQFLAARAAARLIYDHPWSAAVRVLIDSDAYRADPTDAFLAAALRLDPETLGATLDALLASGLARREGERLAPNSSFTADARASEEDQRRLKAHWARVAADRLEDPHEEDLVSMNLFAVSHADLEKVRQLQRAYFRELRSLVAASQPEEAAALVLMQLVSLLPSAQVPDL